MLETDALSSAKSEYISASYCVLQIQMYYAFALSGLKNKMTELRLRAFARNTFFPRTPPLARFLHISLL